MQFPNRLKLKSSSSALELVCAVGPEMEVDVGLSMNEVWLVVLDWPNAAREG